MESGILERIRGHEADIERALESIVQQDFFADGVTNARHRILLDHFKVQQLEVIRGLSEKLLDAYLDEDEIVEAQDAPSEGADVFAAALKQFEGRLANIREYHTTYRDLPPTRNQLTLPDPAALETLFTLGERYGACLDLEPHYNRYGAFVIESNTTVVPEGAGGSCSEEGAAVQARIAGWSESWPSRPEYFRFVPDLPEMMVGAVDATRKLTCLGAYKAFVEKLLEYLVEFYNRIRPLNADDAPRVLGEAEHSCEEYWAALQSAKAEVVVVTDAYGSEEGEEGRGGNDSGSSGPESDGEDQTSSAAQQRKRKRMERKLRRRLPHGVRVSCGVVAPPPLRKYIKSFSVWPLTVVDELADYRSRVLAAGKGSSTFSKEEVKLAQQLPASVADVKAVCILEAKVAAMLKTLLFDTLQTTEKTILRDYSKTTEEREIDRARADDEFLQSLELVRSNSMNSLEAAAMSYVAAQQSLAGQLHQQQPQHLRRPHGPAGAQAAGALGSAGGAAPGAAAKGSDGDLADSLVNEKFMSEDGPPVPRWLVRLQQLEKTFICEVCGGTVYNGPKIFREHFGQERHTTGLRSLGVMQNLHEFAGISTIRGAIEMRDKLGNLSGRFRKRLLEDKEKEEIEDGQGHVLTNRDYTALQKRHRM